MPENYEKEILSPDELKAELEILKERLRILNAAERTHEFGTPESVEEASDIAKRIEVIEHQLKQF